jgi:hypothetical protein
VMTPSSSTARELGSNFPFASISSRARLNTVSVTTHCVRGGRWGGGGREDGVDASAARVDAT